MSKYKYTEDCTEISGFGGDYEKACRNMVIAGMEHLDKNHGSNPTFDQYENIFGLTTNENEDMKKLQNHMLEAEPHCSGAMMQACTNHVLYAYKNGWDKYISQMSKKEQDDTSN